MFDLDKQFIDKTESNIDGFADMTEFMLDAILIMSTIPEEKRLQAISTLKILSR